MSLTQFSLRLNGKQVSGEQQEDVFIFLSYFCSDGRKNFSHVLNENKILRFHLSYLDKKLEIVLDFFHPLPPVSSQPIIKSWWFCFQNISWVWLFLSTFTPIIPVSAWNAIIRSVLGMHSVADNRRLIYDKFDKESFLLVSRKSSPRVGNPGLVQQCRWRPSSIFLFYHP